MSIARASQVRPVTKPPKEAAEFLRCLDPRASKWSFQAFDDEPRKELKNPKLAKSLHGSLEDCAPELARLNAAGAGVFVALNATDLHGRKKENIRGVRAVMADIDNGPHGLDLVRKCHLPPHIIDETSLDRFQAIWRIEPGLPLDLFKGVQLSIAQRFDSDPAVCMTTLVVRLPGYDHCKTDKRFCVRIIETSNGDNYTVDEILKEFPPLKKPHKGGSSRNGLVLRPRAPLEWAKAFYQHEYLTDAGTGSRLVYHRGEFYEWSGTQYVTIGNSNLRSRVYEFFADVQVETRNGAAPFNPDRRKYLDFVDALAAGVNEDEHRDPPFWRAPSQRTDAGELIAFNNGLLNLDSGKLKPPDPLFFNLNSLPYDYDPRAQAPAWEQFLRDVLPDRQARWTLQETAGYLLTPNTSLQKIFLWLGEPRSGRGTTSRVLTGVLGDANVVATSFEDLATPFGLAPLIGKPVATIGDAVESDRNRMAMVLPRLLSISGEDKQSINRKFRDSWHGKLPTRFVMLANQPPRFTDAAGAFAARLVVIRFTQSFRGREDPALTEKLLRERSGILNWCLEGRSYLRKRGHFEMSSASVDEVRAFEELSSPIKKFLRECCDVGDDLRVGCTELYQEYKMWREREGSDRSLTDSQFGIELKAAFGTIERKRATYGRRDYYYHGIALRPAAPRRRRREGWD